MPRTSKYTPLERDSIEGRILALLARRPASAADLAPQLGLTLRSVSWFIQSLSQKKQILPYGYHHKRLLWRRVSAPPAPPRPERKTWQRNSEVGLDENDERWMTYWRMPRAERRQRAMAAT